MKAVLTMELQQDNGTPIITGSQTKSNFTGADIDLVRNFLVSIQLQSFVRLMGWTADGVVPQPTNPYSISINALK